MALTDDACCAQAVHNTARIDQLEARLAALEAVAEADGSDAVVSRLRRLERTAGQLEDVVDRLL